MRQFVLINTFKGGVASALNVGEGTVEYLKDGAPTASATGKEFNYANIAVKTTAGVQPYMIPISKNNFSYVKGAYTAGTKFRATVTVTAPLQKGDYSIIIVKKGTKFNERNKWTGMVHITDTTTTATSLAAKLTAALKGNANHGLTVTSSAAVITFTATNVGEDYEILGADLLQDVKVNISAAGIPAFADAKYVRDLMEKAIAENGINTTYRDAYTYLYPTLYGDNTSAFDGKTFTIFTLRFAEPRSVKTKDDVVNQIVQVAFPTGATGIDTFEKICKGLSGIEVATQ